MVDGIALKEVYTAGTPDFPGDKHGITVSRSGSAEMISVQKCPQCGHSVKVSQ